VGPSSIGQVQDRIGPYKLVEHIGEGGMGEVWRGERTEPVHQTVCLKLIKQGMDTRQYIARFEAERQALALMDHPNIAKVFDAGSTDSGRPYFVMEFVRGIPITEHCDRQRLSVDERLELMAQVCQGVQHAHQKGIIHRDIKPRNILVEYVDGAATPKIIDFGLAKATAQKLTEHTLFTEHGQIVGTPEYMSPEQAEMSTQDIDTRSDIYSLGVLLYDLLTGTLPFASRTLRAAGLVEIQRIIRESEPPKPSSKLSSIRSQAATAEPEANEATLISDKTADREEKPAAIPSAVEIARNRRTNVRALEHDLRGDLDWIVMKCLEKDRRRRYETANELAADIQRHRQHRPVEASPPSASYRLRKFVRRNRTLVAAVGSVVTVLLLAVIGMSLLAGWALRERGRAEQGRAKAEAINEFVTQALAASDPHQGGVQDITITEAMDQALALLDSGVLADQPEVAAGLRLTISEIYYGNARIEQALALAEQAMASNQQLYSGDHPVLARNLDLQALGLMALGRTEESLSLFTESLAMKHRLHPGDSPEVAGGMTNLASSLQDLARDEEALTLQERALAMYRRIYDGDHEDLAATLSDLASSLAYLGRFEEALPNYEAVLAMYRRLFAGDHPHIAGSLGNLASCLQDLDRSEDALPLYEESLAMHERLFQGDHPEIATSLNNLASCLNALGRPEEALPRYEAALEIYRRLFTSDHFHVARSLNNLANCLYALDRKAEAMLRYREALDMSRRVFPPEHPGVLYSQRGLARSLFGLGRYAEVEPLLLNIAEICETSDASRQFHGQGVIRELVRLYEAWQANEPEGNYEEEAVKWRVRLEAPDTPGATLKR